MSKITTHVLDTALGKPASGINVRLLDAHSNVIAEGTTDTDGRVGSLGPEKLAAGTYRLLFETGPYLTGVADSDEASFYPEVMVAFTVSRTEKPQTQTGLATDAESAGEGRSNHYHVPLLLSPFGYSTYRGS